MTRGQAGRLSVVATPIGNLEDLTLRGLRILREADAILAEDTRRTRILCTHHGVATPIRSFHAHTPDSRIPSLLEELHGGAHFALVTDAGTPLVSDPGIRLVTAAADAGVTVETIPGASAVTAALTVAGLRCDVFRFVGFLPRSGSRRKRALRSIAADPGATVLFEAPVRLGRTLRELASETGATRRAAVCRELTKVHEEVVRGSLEELAARFEEGTRGEVTVVVEATGERVESAEADAPAPEELDRRIREALARGESPRDVARALAADTGMGRRDAYQLVLQQRTKDGP